MRPRAADAAAGYADPDAPGGVMSAARALTTHEQNRANARAYVCVVCVRLVATAVERMGGDRSGPIVSLASPPPFSLSPYFFFFAVNVPCEVQKQPPPYPPPCLARQRVVATVIGVWMENVFVARELFG